jgi:hypothetical protein
MKYGNRMFGKRFVPGLLVFCFWSAAIGCGGNPMPPLRDGDIVFQNILSSQSEALRLAMHSPYTHVGVLYIEGGETNVYEAVGPVMRTPFEGWIRHGTGGHFVVKRLRQADRYFTGDGIARFRQAGKKYEGRPYDSRFLWSDDRIYCSELVWKMYESAFGIRIGELRKFGEFDLSSPAVVKIIKERFPNGAPMNEPVVSPADIFDSGLLETIYER